MNIWPILQTKLPHDRFSAMVHLGRVAVRHGMGLYLVGGAVRDLLMDRPGPTPDLDFVAEGDAVALAHRAAAESGAAVTPHKQFGTATLTFENGFQFDLATARTETYHKPCALPRVAPAQSILEDLARRDFTINAMAASVSGAAPGDLVDPHGGRDDLENRLLRVLHPQSFMDDPTRILRGIRFQARFDLNFEYQTQSLLHAALDSEILLRVSAARMRKEIQACFESHARIPIMKQLNALGIDSGALAPGLGFQTHLVAPEDLVAAALQALCLEPGGLAPQEWIAYLMAAIQGAGDETLLNLARRLALSRRHAAPLLNPLFYSYDARAPLDDPETGPAQVEDILAGAEDEVLVFLHAAAYSDHVRRHIEGFVFSTRAVRLEINGGDLLGMGHEPSPIFAQVLREVRRCKIQGKVKDRRQELALARKLLNAWD